MLLAALPLVSVAVTVSAPAPSVEAAIARPVERVATPRVAQVRLAETLAEAEAIESVHARGRAVTFEVIHDGVTLALTATVRPTGEVVALTIAPAPPLAAQLHGLTWLGEELAHATAVTRLVIDDDGAVTIATHEGQRYIAIPGRGSGGASVAHAP